MDKMNCVVCQSYDILMEEEPEFCNRPSFTCRGCGHNWSYGLSGGDYGIYCRAREAKRKSHEPHYVVRRITKREPDADSGTRVYHFRSPRRKWKIKK